MRVVRLERESMEHFRGKPLMLLIAGAILLMAATILVPSPERWRHSVQLALIVIALGPWMLNTIFRHRWSRYVMFCLGTVGTMIAVEGVLG